LEQRRGNRKELADLLHYARLLRENRQCYQEYCQQKTKGKREKFYAAHQEELAIYQMVKRELEKRLPDKKLHLDAWQAEYDALKAERPEKYEALKATRQDVRFVQAITNRVDAVRHKDKAIQHTPER
jgi:predicted ferric reductase